jgi:acyl-CoA thioesterase
VPTRFVTDTAVVARDDGAFDATIDPGWFIVRGPNGGYVAAIFVRAFEATVDDAERAPRSLTIHYLRPPVVGPVVIEVTVERSGRSLTSLSARMTQDGRLVAIALAAFAVGQPPIGGGSEFGDVAMPVVPPADALQPAPRPPFPLPMTDRYRTAWAIGTPPNQLEAPAEHAEVGGWIRLEDDPPVDYAVVAALTDAWMPAMFVRTLGTVAVPTIDLTIHFRSPPPFDPAWSLVHFRSRHSSAGFVEEQGEVWSSDGALLAQSVQLAMLLPQEIGQFTRDE